jgi:hypothetical protein
MRQRDQAGSRLARLGGDGFLDPGIVVHRRKCAVIPRDGAAASIPRLSDAT